MHVLTIDTEREPGDAVVVEVDDRTPDVAFGEYEGRRR